MQCKRPFSTKRSNFNNSKTLKDDISRDTKYKKKTQCKFNLGYKENYTVS